MNLVVPSAASSTGNFTAERFRRFFLLFFLFSSARDVETSASLVKAPESIEKGIDRESTVVSAVNTIPFLEVRARRTRATSTCCTETRRAFTIALQDVRTPSDAFVIMIYSEFAFLMNNKRRQLDVVYISPFVESRRDSVTYHSRRHTVRMFHVAATLTIFERLATIVEATLYVQILAGNY